MNTDQLKSFIAVVEYRSFHQAARALFLSQPSVTARIKALEQELGVALFKKQGRKTTLTDEGQAFLSYAERVLSLLDDARHAIDSSSRKHLLTRKRQGI